MLTATSLSTEIDLILKDTIDGSVVAAYSAAFTDSEIDTIKAIGLFLESDPNPIVSGDETYTGYKFYKEEFIISGVKAIRTLYFKEYDKMQSAI